MPLFVEFLCLLLTISNWNTSFAHASDDLTILRAQNRFETVKGLCVYSVRTMKWNRLRFSRTKPTFFLRTPLFLATCKSIFSGRFRIFQRDFFKNCMKWRNFGIEASLMSPPRSANYNSFVFVKKILFFSMGFTISVNNLCLFYVRYCL